MQAVKWWSRRYRETELPLSAGKSVVARFILISASQSPLHLCDSWFSGPSAFPEQPITIGKGIDIKNLFVRRPVLPLLFRKKSARGNTRKKLGCPLSYRSPQYPWEKKEKRSKGKVCLVGKSSSQKGGFQKGGFGRCSLAPKFPSESLSLQCYPGRSKL